MKKLCALACVVCFKWTQQHFLLLIPNFCLSCSACSLGCVTCEPGGHLISRRSLPTSWIFHFACFFFCFFSKLLCLYSTVKPCSDTSRSTQLSVVLRSGTAPASFHLAPFSPPQNQRSDSVRCCLNTILSTKMSWS